MRQYFLFCAIFFVSGCFWEAGFYEYYRDEDLWRLPLIKPYQLTNIAGTTRDWGFGDNWRLQFRTVWDSLSLQHVNVSMINVENGIIYGYGTANPCDHFIINTRTGSEMTYKDVGEWENELIRSNVDYTRVYDVLDLFGKFKNEKKLLWRPAGH